ncbi:hypothetical protein EJB05_13099, partial [Eragrostis curvula]
METRAKKRKRSKAAVTQESTEKPPAPSSAAAAADAPDEPRSQEAPPPVAGGGVDRISGLSDAILGEIVSLLPTTEAARTQILSPRWRHVWRTAPLNLDATHLAATDEARASAVSLILSAHAGPRPPLLLPPPVSTFRFSPTLRLATFSKCDLRDFAMEALRFPELKQLALVEVRISEGSLHTFISICPALESLLLDKSSGFQSVRISSSNLKSIGVGAYYGRRIQNIWQLIIVDAPCLEKLLYLHAPMDLRVSVISAPKLATLGCFSGASNYSRLVFDTIAIQGLKVVSFKTAVHNVKILAINTGRIDLDMVIDLLKCFPCLEKLYIKSSMSGPNLWRRKHKDFISSFDIDLKEIVLDSYRGIRLQASFASFFILNARELEFIRFVVGQRDYNEAFFAEQHRVLQMEKRASRVARLDFTTDKCRHDLLHVNHVRDLSITDPFRCNC